MLLHDLILQILLILSVAWALGFVFLHFGMPAMLGELLAGIILGPPILGLVDSSEALELFAELGIFFVMFYTGLEMDTRDLTRNAWPSVAAAIAGFALPFILGYFTASLFGGTLMQSLFVGMCTSITAIAVGAMVLKALNLQGSNVGHVIMGAALIDDVLALIGLSVLFGLARTGEVSLAAVSWTFFKAFAFFGIAFLIGELVLPRFAKYITDTEAKGFTFGLIVSLAMAYLAELAGLHLIIGAFMAGIYLRREIMDERVFEKLADRFYGIAYGFLVPVFFVSLSFHLEFEMTVGFAIFTAVLILMAIAGKVIGSGAAVRAFGFTANESLVVGLGMNGRGAVELVVASVILGLSRELEAAGQIVEPLLTGTQFSALVLMAFFTTLMTPIALHWAVVRSCTPEAAEKFCSLMDRHRK